jgi:DNA repair protein RadC
MPTATAEKIRKPISQLKYPAVHEIPIQRIRLVAEGVARYDQGVSSVASFEQLEAMMRPLFDGAPTEEMWIGIMDSAMRPICIYKAGFGTDNQCVVYPKEIMKAVLLSGGTSIVLAHNHPSGECRPSQQDRELTRAIQSAAQVLQVRVIDHLIVTENGSFSFRREGLL